MINNRGCRKHWPGLCPSGPDETKSPGTQQQLSTGTETNKSVDSFLNFWIHTSGWFFSEVVAVTSPKQISAVVYMFLPAAHQRPLTWQFKNHKNPHHVLVNIVIVVRWNIRWNVSYCWCRTRRKNDTSRIRFFFFTTFRVFIISIQMAFDGTFTAVVSPRSVRAPRLDAVHWSRGSDLDHVLLPLFTPRWVTVAWPGKDFQPEATENQLCHGS